MFGTADNHVMLNKPDLERPIPCFYSHMPIQILKKDEKVKGDLFGMSVLAAEVRQKIVGDEGAIMTEASVYV